MTSVAVLDRPQVADAGREIKTARAKVTTENYEEVVWEGELPVGMTLGAALVEMQTQAGVSVYPQVRVDGAEIVTGEDLERRTIQEGHTYEAPDP